MKAASFIASLVADAVALDIRITTDHPERAFVAAGERTQLSAALASMRADDADVTRSALIGAVAAERALAAAPRWQA